MATDDLQTIRGWDLNGNVPVLNWFAILAAAAGLIYWLTHLDLLPGAVFLIFLPATSPLWLRLFQTYSLEIHPDGYRLDRFVLGICHRSREFSKDTLVDVPDDSIYVDPFCLVFPGIKGDEECFGPIFGNMSTARQIQAAADRIHRGLHVAIRAEPVQYPSGTRRIKPRRSARTEKRNPYLE